MAVTVEDVRAVANLARLELEAGEEQRLVADFNRILGYMETLNEVDTEGVAPTSHPVPMPQVFRSDQTVEPFQGRDAILEAAPQREGDYYRVPRIID